MTNNPRTLESLRVNLSLWHRVGWYCHPLLLTTAARASPIRQPPPAHGDFNAHLRVRLRLLVRLGKGVGAARIAQ